MKRSFVASPMPYLRPSPYWDREGNALYANRVALEYTGLTLEDVNGGAFRTQVFLHSHESEHFRNEPKKLRGFVTSRTFVIQTSINQFIFSNLKLEP